MENDKTKPELVKSEKIEKIYDIAIIGSGPAANSAAIYCKDKNTIIIEGLFIGNNGPGGQLTTTTNVDNYPGYPYGIQGPELIEIMQNQTSAFRVSETVVQMLCLPECGFLLKTSEENYYYSQSVIIASGAQAKRLFVPGAGDDEYWQKGVSTCAVCDGYAFMDKTVIVVGGGDSAMEEALYLSLIASKVILVHRRDDFRARADMLEKVKHHQKIEIKTSHVLEKIKGDEYMTAAVFLDLKSKKKITIEAEGLFFAIGHLPNTDFLHVKDATKCSVNLDSENYIITDEECRTSCPGVFACGDVQDNRYKQAITAAASGCTAGLSALKYLENLK